MNNKNRFDLVIESENIDKGNLYISGIHAAKNVENLEAANIQAVLSIVEMTEMKRWKLVPLL
jgi:hypothetical protein